MLTITPNFRTSGQFTLGQLEAGYVRLRYDEVHDPDAVFDLVDPLSRANLLYWDMVLTDDSGYSRVVEVRPDHIITLTEAHFDFNGNNIDFDNQHDAHDITITITLPPRSADGTVQIWTGSAGPHRRIVIPAQMVIR